MPHYYVDSPGKLGSLIKERRKSIRKTQNELADLANVSTHFLSDLENGKPTIEIGKALNVLTLLGLDLVIVPREGEE